MQNVQNAVLTQLIEDIIQGLARLGWGMVGIPYPEYFEKNPP
jgi:hypothetical protein